MRDGSVPLLKGTVDVMILKALTWGPLHGYAISRWIAATTGAVFELQEGALYPALRRLEARGWVESEWTVTDTGREAREYALTEEGRSRLRAEVRSWTAYVDAMGRLLHAKRGG